MRLRPLELARPGHNLVVSVAAVVSHASASAQLWPERRGQSVCYAQLGWCPLDGAERIPVGIACYCILPDRRTGTASLQPAPTGGSRR